MGAALSVAEITKTFGGLVALSDVSLDVPTGYITAVIGPNGAGKSTLFNVIAGVYAPTHGEVRLGDRVLNGTPAHSRVRLGLARTFQQVLLFGNMTALENVMAGRHTRSRCGLLDAALRTPRLRHEEEEIYLQAVKFLNLVGLGGRANDPADSLPFGQQRLVAIARALASEPQVLMLDEPGAGLNVIEKQDLGELIQRIRELGITVLLVEHDMDLVMRLADWVVVLDFGHKIAEGRPATVQRDPKVIAAYLGEETV